MIRREAREEYYERTTTASNLARQLAFAGIAIVWIFRTTGANGPALPDALLLPALLLALALAVDLSQYIYAAAAWGWFHRRKELSGAALDEEVGQAPRWINWPTNFLFVAKVILVAVAYGYLIAFLWNRQP